MIAGAITIHIAAARGRRRWRKRAAPSSRQLDILEHVLRGTGVEKKQSLPLPRPRPERRPVETEGGCLFSIATPVLISVT
jgi:hypothetical protein